MVDSVHVVEDASKQILIFFCGVSIGRHYGTSMVSRFVNPGLEVKPSCFRLINSQLEGIVFH